MEEDSADTMSEDSGELEICLPSEEQQEKSHTIASHVALNNPLRVVTVPASPVVPVVKTTNVYINSKKEDEKRLRKEWDSKEDTIFLEGLRKHKLDFGKIQEMLPHRSRSQIRTHYRYIAKSLQENQSSKSLGGKQVRRLRTRGRPPRKDKVEKPNELFSALVETIKALEKDSPTTKKRGRPSKNRIGTMMEFDRAPAARTPTPVCVGVVNGGLEVPTTLLLHATAQHSGIESPVMMILPQGPLKVPLPSAFSPAFTSWKPGEPPEAKSKRTDA